MSMMSGSKIHPARKRDAKLPARLSMSASDLTGMRYLVIGEDGLCKKSELDHLYDLLGIGTDYLNATACFTWNEIER